MESSFHKTAKISPDTLRALSKRNDHSSYARTLIVIVLYLLAAFWVVMAWDSYWWNFGLSQIVFGVMVCSVFAGLHETAHGTAFSSRKLNGLAAFIFGVFHLYPSSIFREFHFTHHRFTHIPDKDPEISFGGKPAPSVISSFPMYIGWLSGLPLILVKSLMIGLSVFGMPEYARVKALPFIRARKKKEECFLPSLWLLLWSI